MMKHIEKAIDYKLLHISSTAFEAKGIIPAKYSCDGININPPLDIEDIPEETKCLALIVENPDAPLGTWVHWLVWNIPVTHHIKENEIQGTQGMNGFEEYHYGGPCPGWGTHHYFFKVYALDELLNISPYSGKLQLEKAMSEHIIGFGQIIGLYKRKK